MMRYLIAGAAGHAQEVAWSLREQLAARHEPCELVFFDDRVPPGPLASGLGAVAGGLDRLCAEVADDALPVLGIGLPASKRAIVDRLGNLGVPWTTVVHPGATIGPNVQLGEGSYVAAGAIVTLNVRIGRFATVNMHCQVAHDGVVGDFATLHPDTHLAGGVTIGEGAELGTSSVVIPGVAIGPRAVLGAGCVAVRPLAGGRTYVGVPARACHGGETRSITAASFGPRRTWTRVAP
jgi:sugar O-acyltransferase (sialic acid O-acetyltransferase NeuD family)